MRTFYLTMSISSIYKGRNLCMYVCMCHNDLENWALYEVDGRQVYGPRKCTMEVVWISGSRESKQQYWTPKNR